MLYSFFLQLDDNDGGGGSDDDFDDNDKDNDDFIDNGAIRQFHNPT